LEICPIRGKSVPPELSSLFLLILPVNIAQSISPGWMKQVESANAPVGLNGFAADMKAEL
jgi:hypothetical protein